MEEDAPVIYGLEFQARALTSQIGEADAIRFLVGTQSLRFENQVHQVDFDEENNIINKNVFRHKEGEIWQINASPVDKDVLATAYNNATDSKAEVKAALWRIPSEFDTSVNEDTSSNAESLSLLCHLDTADYGDVKCLMWHPSGDTNTLISLADNHILVWDIEATARLNSHTSLDTKGQPKFTSGRWNPHHNCTQIATANDTCIRGWDLRSMKQVYYIEMAHSQLVRDLDFNPNKQYYLASCGDDCKAKFWDIRKTSEPVLVRADHSHWVWNIRFNHFHDQLVLTSSSDCRVNLTNMASISSEPFGHLVDDEETDEGHEFNTKEKNVTEDHIIATYEEHEDSVYAVE